MSNELLFIVSENDDGTFEARAIGQSIFTFAKSYPELRANLIEAILCHFDPHELPESIGLLNAAQAEHLAIPA